MKPLLHPGIQLPETNAAPGARLLRMWRRLSPLPGGRWMFSRLLGQMVPYSGGIRAVVEVLEPGTAQIRMKEHRAVRNHLRSVHAVAVTNLGELATGLATLTALPAGVRGIVTQLSTRYHAKARGRLTARCSVRVPKDLDEAELTAETEIQDESGTVVATVTAHWRTRVEAR